MNLDAGDVAWIDFDPIKGTEQAGRRPAIVISDRRYHDVSRRAVVCPITSNARPWTFKVLLPQEMKTKGAILIDQVRTIDRPTRVLAHIERAPNEVMDEVRGRLAALLGLNPV